MQLLALRAAERAIWRAYQKRAEAGDNSMECRRLGQDSTWVFLVWNYNTLSNVQRIGIPIDCHRQNDWS
jgi:hypothetical protein